MVKLNILRTATGVGVFLGAVHAAWAAAVAAGWGQPLLDWIFRLHFIDPPYRILPFDLMTAVSLIGMTFVIGAVLGLAFAAVWNGISKP